MVAKPPTKKPPVSNVVSEYWNKRGRESAPSRSEVSQGASPSPEVIKQPSQSRQNETTTTIAEGDKERVLNEIGVRTYGSGGSKVAILGVSRAGEAAKEKYGGQVSGPRYEISYTTPSKNSSSTSQTLVPVPSGTKEAMIQARQVQEEEKFGKVAGISPFGIKQDGSVDLLSYGVVRETKTYGSPYELVGKEVGLFETKSIVQPVRDDVKTTTFLNKGIMGTSGFQVSEKSKEYGVAYTEKSGGITANVLPVYSGGSRGVDIKGSFGGGLQSSKGTQYTETVRLSAMPKFENGGILLSGAGPYLSTVSTFESEYNKAAGITVLDKTALGGFGKTSFIVPVRETSGFVGGLVELKTDSARSALAGDYAGSVGKEFVFAGEVAAVGAIGKGFELGLKPAYSSYVKPSVRFVDSAEFGSVGAGSKMKGYNVKTGEFFESEKGVSVAFSEQVSRPSDVFVVRYGQEVVGTRKGTKEIFGVAQKSDVYKVVEEKGSIRYDLVERGQFLGTGASANKAVFVLGSEGIQITGKNPVIFTNRGFIGQSRSFGKTTVTTGRRFEIGQLGTETATVIGGIRTYNAKFGMTPVVVERSGPVLGVRFGSESVTGYTKMAEFVPEGVNVRSAVFAQGRVGGPSGSRVDLPASLGNIRVASGRNRAYSAEPLTATLLSVERVKPQRYRGVRETGVSAQSFGGERLVESVGRASTEFSVPKTSFVTGSSLLSSKMNSRTVESFSTSFVNRLSSKYSVESKMSSGYAVNSISRQSLGGKNVQISRSGESLRFDTRFDLRQTERATTRTVQKSGVGYNFDEFTPQPPPPRIPGFALPNLSEGLGKSSGVAKLSGRGYDYSKSFYVSLGGFSAPRLGKKLRFSGFETRG